MVDRFRIKWVFTLSSPPTAIPNSKFLEAETLDLSFKSSLFEES